MAPLSNIYRKILFNSVLQRKGRIVCQFISTSGKKAENKEVCEQQPESYYKKVPDFSKPSDSKNWISYGFDKNDKTEDRFRYHFFGFTFLSYLVCGLVFIYGYAPDRKRNDWARREAFIKLHEREQLGLDPIDPNYIDPSKIVLPPDEELEDDDIVI